MRRYLALAILVCLFLTGCTAARSGSGDSGFSRKIPSRELELRLNLAESHIKNDQPQQALQELLKIESRADHLSRFHFDMGMTFLSLDELERSYAGFAEATKIDPDFGEAWNNQGKLLEALNRPKDAEKAYQKALSILTYITPEFPAYNLSTLYLKQNRLQEAEKLARKALARNWRYLPAYKLLADILVAQNRTDEAESVLQKGIEANPDSPNLMLALAEQQIRQGKAEQAQTLFQKILSKHPKSREAKVAKDYLSMF